jgi:hypothetical protein
MSTVSLITRYVSYPPHRRAIFKQSLGLDRQGPDWLNRSAAPAINLPNCRCDLAVVARGCPPGQDRPVDLNLLEHRRRRSAVETSEGLRAGHQSTRAQPAWPMYENGHMLVALKRALAFEFDLQYRDMKRSCIAGDVLDLVAAPGLKREGGIDTWYPPATRGGSRWR